MHLNWNKYGSSAHNVRNFSRSLDYGLNCFWQLQLLNPTYWAAPHPREIRFEITGVDFAFLLPQPRHWRKSKALTSVGKNQLPVHETSSFIDDSPTDTEANTCHARYINCHLQIPTPVVPYTATRASAAADRTARRSGSACAKYSVSHRMVIKTFLLLGLAAEYRRWVWSTVVRRPLEVYHAHWRTKLAAPETISLSRNVENRRLNVPHFYLAPPLGVNPLVFRLRFWQQKTSRNSICASVCVSVCLSQWANGSQPFLGQR